MRRIIIVLTDGLRPDAIHPERMPALHGLAMDYAHSWHATTVRPSTTIAALATLTTGLLPQDHGLLEHGPGFLGRLAQLTLLPREFARAGLPCRILAGDLKALERAVLPVLMRAAGFRSFGCVGRRASDVARKAVSVCERREAGVQLVYLNDCDRAGHEHGWMSPEYLEAAVELDAAVAILAPLVADSLVIVLADHGGGGVTATHHREPHWLNDRIPLVLAGDRVARGARFEEPVSILDVAPTMCHWLGLPVPTAFAGRVLSEVVTAPTALRVA